MTRTIRSFARATPAWISRTVSFWAAILTLWVSMILGAPAPAQAADMPAGDLRISKFCPGKVEWIPIRSLEEASAVSGCSIAFDVLGPIDDRLADLFLAATDALKDKNDLSALDSHVTLFSEGGSVAAAIRLGRRIRDLQMRVAIESWTECLSSCVLVFASGVERTFKEPAHLGIHRLYFDPDDFAELDYANADAAYAGAADEVRSYLRDMRVDEALVDLMQSVSIDDIRYLTYEEAERLRLAGVDPVYEDLLRSKIIAEIGMDRFREADWLIRTMTEIMEACSGDRSCLEAKGYDQARSAFFDLDTGSSAEAGRYWSYRWSQP